MLHTMDWTRLDGRSLIDAIDDQITADWQVVVRPVALAKKVFPLPARRVATVSPYMRSRHQMPAKRIA